MTRELTWNDAQKLGVLLSSAHPQLEPLAVQLTDLQKYVTQLPDFKDDPNRPDEGKLEAIRDAWHDEFLDRTQA
jgi:FeS assembly protein IscX